MRASSISFRREGVRVKQFVATPDHRQIRQAARQEIIRQVEQGTRASIARMRSAVPMHRTTVYRLLKRVQSEGKNALAERRHGHPIKLRGDILTCMIDYCQSHPSTSSSEVQRLLAERFGLSVSVSQLNRVRAAHCLSRTLVPREKKAKNRIHDCPRHS